MLLVISCELTFNASNTLDDIHADVCYSKRSSYEPFKEEFIDKYGENRFKTRVIRAGMFAG